MEPTPFGLILVFVTDMAAVITVDYGKRVYSELEDEAEELREQLEDAEDVIDRAKSACIIWDYDAYMVLSILNQY